MPDSPQITKNTTYPSADKFSSYRRLFVENKRYRQFWIAGAISQIGNWFNYIGIFVLLTQLSGSAGAVSWFLIAKFIPTSFLGPAAGVVADRFSRKTIMITCDLCRALIVLVFLLASRPEHVWLIYTLALIQESLWTFADPARRASIPNICSTEELILANALSGATWSIMLSFGAALGGFITYLFGWQIAIIIDALTFLLSASILAGVNLPNSTRKTKKQGFKEYTGINDIIEGCHYISKHREVSTLLLVKSGWALSGGILVLLTIFGEQVFATPSGGGKSGILYSFRGIGAALGPILAWHFLGQTKKSMYRAISLSFFISASAYLCFSQAPTIIYAALFVLLGHMGGAIQWVFSTTILQQLVPDQFRGRVFATEMALLTFVLSLSIYFTGLGLDRGIDPRTITIWLSLLFLLPGSFWTFYLKINPIP